VYETGHQADMFWLCWATARTKKISQQILLRIYIAQVFQVKWWKVGVARRQSQEKIYEKWVTSWSAALLTQVSILSSCPFTQRKISVPDLLSI
jgi:hypothetical protein